MSNMLAPLRGSVFLPADAIGLAISQIDEQPKRLRPDQTLQELEMGGGPKGARQLYESVYQPLSAAFAHGSGVALMRHVRQDDRLISRAHFPWVKRSPAHVADACAGLLCAVLTGGAVHPSHRRFVSYADHHAAYVSTVIGGMAVGHAFRHSVRSLRSLGVALHALRDFDVFVRSASWAEASTEEKAQKTELVLREIFSCFGIATEAWTGMYAQMLVSLLREPTTDGTEQSLDDQGTTS